MAANTYARPVIPLLVSLIAGIGLGACFPGYRAWAYGIAIVGSGMLLFSAFQWRLVSSVLIGPLIFFIALGYLSIQTWVAPRFPVNHVIHYVTAHKWKITGIIDQNPIKDNVRLKLILRTQTLARGNVSIAVTGKLRVTVYGQGPELSLGDQILFSGKLTTFNNFNNPGGFDYKRYMAFKGIWCSVSTQGQRIEILKTAAHRSFQRYLNKCRDKVSKLIQKTPEGEHRGVLQALITGERSQIPPGLREAFNRAGVGHLLAISGLHIGIVGTAAFLFFSWLLSRFRIFLRKAWVRKGAAFLSFFPILIYALLAGMSPSTQRALIMVAVFLTAFFFEKDQDLMNTLAIAAMLILVVDPPSLFSISFQLSFVSVLSIIYGLLRVHISGLFDSGPPKMNWRFAVFKKLVIFFCVSVFAILGTLPLVMLHFNQISLVGVMANFIIVPLIGFLAVPLGLLAVFGLPISMAAATWSIKASAAILIRGIDAVWFFSDLPFAAVKTITPSFLEIGCYYLLAWALLNLKSEPGTRTRVNRTVSDSDRGPGSKNGENQGIPPKICAGRLGLKCSRLLQKWRTLTFSRYELARMIGGIVMLVLCADIGYWVYQRFWRDDLRVTIIDVGQGSAVLMELPRGGCILVDGGGFSDNDVFDVGGRVIAPFLWRKKIKTVDSLILTHPNSDHLNGLIYIARHFNVKNLWTNNETRDTAGFGQFMTTVAEKKINLLNFKDMPRTYEIEGVRVKVLYPPKDFLVKRIKDTWRTPNNNSMVVKVTFGSISFLFPGDILEAAESELAAVAGNELKSTVLLAPHHGSISSNTPQFLEMVQPEIAVISSGWKNSFHFPHPLVLSRYAERNYKVFRTDIQGAINFSTDGQFLGVTPFVAEIQKN